jgi:hypothetical protein
VKVLSQRELNRATLARQLLLERADVPVLEAVEQLAGLQAQTTHSWYAGLWSRLDPFDPHETGRLLAERKLVRIALMRSTIHLVTAADCLWMRPLLDQVVKGPYVRDLSDQLVVDVAKTARKLLEREPLTSSELERRLVERFPDHADDRLWRIPRGALPLVQVAPRGVWGQSGPAAHTTAEKWLGRPLAKEPSLEQLVIRYLAAFGPASVMDAQAWSGLTRLGAVFEGLRDRFAVFADEGGRELFDLPDAPRPPAKTKAPVRYLYDYDNLLLSHADRSRFEFDDMRRKIWTRYEGIPGSVLVDGLVRGLWTVRRERGKSALLDVMLSAPLKKREEGEVVREGERLLEFLAADVPARDVKLRAWE